ncbi:hypothetical protein ACIP93_18450 [Streptomyces sp. NPDC088745]
MQIPTCGPDPYGGSAGIGSTSLNTTRSTSRRKQWRTPRDGSS